MLVLSREIGTSIHVSSAKESCLITVLKLLPARRAVSVLVNRALVSKPGQLESRTLEVTVDSVVKVGETTEVTLVEWREDRVRIGINAPKESSVHRFEVYEAISRGNRRDDPEDGMTESRSPQPSSPKPPSFDVRLEEPPTAVQ